MVDRLLYYNDVRRHIFTDVYGEKNSAHARPVDTSRAGVAWARDKVADVATCRLIVRYHGNRVAYIRYRHRESRDCEM